MVCFNDKPVTLTTKKERKKEMKQQEEEEGRRGKKGPVVWKKIHFLKNKTQMRLYITTRS